MNYEEVVQKCVREVIGTHQLKDVEAEVKVLICRLFDTDFLKRASKDIMTFKNPAEAVWFLPFAFGELVGSMCCVITGKSARMKSAFLIESARGNGIYSGISRFRLAWAREQGCTDATCFSTIFSRSQLLRDGFKEVSEKTPGIVFMRKVF